MADGAFGLTQELERETAGVWAKVKDHVTPLEWPAQARLISEINRLKRERNAVILAHNYMTPEIFHGVGDYVGDSLGLAKEAARSDAKVIVQAGVHFMAETSKILSPEKTVLIPDLRAGCSLASSITGADVRLIKQRYPGLPVVTYVNTTADVKAETDICCTSANAVQVVEWAAKEWGVDRVILIPDEYLARNVAAQTTVGIIAWKGRCEVHERFTVDDIAEMRAAYDDRVLPALEAFRAALVRAGDSRGDAEGRAAALAYPGAAAEASGRRRMGRRDRGRRCRRVRPRRPGRQLRHRRVASPAARARRGVRLPRRRPQRPGAQLRRGAARAPRGGSARARRPSAVRR